jgi:hypothetical protein
MNSFEVVFKKKWFNRYAYPFLKIFFISGVSFALIHFEKKIQEIVSVYIFFALIFCFTVFSFISSKFEDYLKDLRVDDLLTKIIKVYGHELFNNNFDKFRVTLFEENLGKKTGHLSIVKRLNGQVSGTKWLIDKDDMNKCEGVSGRAWYLENKVLRVKLNARQSSLVKASQLFISTEVFQQRTLAGKMNPVSITASAIKMKDGTKMVLVIDTDSNYPLPKNSSMNRLCGIIKNLMEEL